MNDAFSRCHPIVNFLYFTLVFAFSMIFSQPVCLAISLICAFAYSVYLNGRRAVKFNLLYLIPMLLVSALIYPVFSHQGVTLITYLPNGNPLTLESIVYGAAAGTMLISVIAWFSCYNAIMTSDKFVYLFGRIIPALSLILSMILRFVPRFRDQMKIISNAQKCVGRDVSQGNIIQRARNAVKVMSIMVTWALENAIETADSMRSRGYGLPGRTAFSIYRFDSRDRHALAMISLLGLTVLICSILGGAKYRYFPSIKGDFGSPATIILMASYLALCLTPMAINLEEDRKWRVTRSAA